MEKHKWKIVGGFFGLVFAILSIALSVWWAIFIYLSVGAGIFIGWRLDLGGGLRNIIEGFFSSSKD